MRARHLPHESAHADLTRLGSPANPWPTLARYDCGATLVGTCLGSPLACFPREAHPYVVDREAYTRIIVGWGWGALGGLRRIARLRTAPTPATPEEQAAPASANPTAGPSTLPTPEQLYEHIRRGVAVIERAGQPLAIGTVLGQDGRILTALSGLGGGDGADVRYADGTTVHARVGLGDKATDLALLVPQSAKWTDGLHASEADPTGAELRAMLPARGGHLGPAEAGIKGRVDAHARDGEPLAQMLDVDIKGPLIVGAPLLDSTGSVVAVLVRACKGVVVQGPYTGGATGPWAAWASQSQTAAKPVAPACTPGVFGAPVSTIRSFLAKTPPGATVPTPWLGIRGEAATASSAHGVRVVAVAPQSPAEKAGLKPGVDLIIAVDGQPVDSPERLADTIGKHAAGDVVKLLVFGERFREVSVGLRTAP